MFELGDAYSELVQLKRIIDAGLGAVPQPLEAIGIWGCSPEPLEDFLLFFGKKANLMLLDHISRLFRAT